MRSAMQKTASVQYDFIVSVKAIAYVQPSRMRIDLVKRLYRALTNNGIAALYTTNILPLFDDQRIPLSDEGIVQKVEELNDLWRKSSFKGKLMLAKQDYDTVLFMRKVTEKHFCIPPSYVETLNY